ncbi:4038_t:CDS:2, partial [Ambispora leptoticha]
MTGEDGAIAATEIETQKSIKVATEIGNLFELCKKAHGTVQNQVNKYQKSGKNYADEAWKKAENGQKERDKNFGDALKEATPKD